MIVYLLRHGLTAYNAKHRYLGRRTDAPLSREGLAALRPADFAPDTVYVSTMRRARQTAEVLFPDAVLIPVPHLEEMDFGAFEGRTAQEMAGDPAYRAWVDGQCLGRTPGGEDRLGFSDRICGAFAALVDAALAENRNELVIVAHGGTQMAALERFARPRREYWQWQSPPAGGWTLDAGTWRENGTLSLTGPVRYAREA